MESPQPSPELSPPSTVSWESLLWGIVTIALNSMSQPSGAVCGYKADVGFLLRSSPVICVIDAVQHSVHLLYSYFVSQPRSFSKARDRLIENHRFQRESHNRYVALGKSEWYGRAVVFVITVSQFVKIVALGGVLWSKVIAMCYLGSFLLMEFFVVWPAAWRWAPSTPGPSKEEISRVDNDDNAVESVALPPRNETLFTYASIALAVAFMLWFTSAACRDIFGQPHHTLLSWAAIVTGSLGTFLAVPGFWYSIRHSGTTSWSEIKTATLLLFIVIVAPAGFYIGGWFVPVETTTVLVGLGAAMLTTLWAGLGFVYALETLRLVRKPGRDRERKKVEQFAAVYFFVLHFGTGLLFYTCSYNAAGTIKPSWTEKLG